MTSDSEAAPWDSPESAISEDGHWWWAARKGWQRMPYVDTYGNSWDGEDWLSERRPPAERWEGPEPSKPRYTPDRAVGARKRSEPPPVASLQQPPMPPPNQQWTPDQVQRYRASLGLSPDGHYWWDGAAWQPHGVRVPAGAFRSATGQQWWDGASWQPPIWHGGGPGYAYAVPRPTNGLAIASLVLGILWLYWVGSVLAVIFGHIALSQIRQGNDGGRGLAIAGLVLGYVGVGILILVIIIGAIAASSGIPSGL